MCQVLLYMILFNPQSLTFVLLLSSFNRSETETESHTASKWQRHALAMEVWAEALAFWLRHTSPQAPQLPPACRDFTPPRAALIPLATNQGGICLWIILYCFLAIQHPRFFSFNFSVHSVIMLSKCLLNIKCAMNNWFIYYKHFSSM